MQAADFRAAALDWLKFCFVMFGCFRAVAGGFAFLDGVPFAVYAALENFAVYYTGRPLERIVRAWAAGIFIVVAG